MRSPSANQQDLSTGLLCLVIGVAGFAQSLSYNVGTPLRMGPGFFPAMVFGALTFISLAICARAFWQDGDPVGRFAWRPLFVVLLSVLIFALGVERLGFIVSAAVLVLVACLAGARLNPLQMVALALGLTAFCWFVFVFALGLPLPVWPEAVS